MLSRLDLHKVKDVFLYFLKILTCWGDIPSDLELKAHEVNHVLWFWCARVQEIQSHKFIHLHQNQETWLNSWTHSSISDEDVTTLLHVYINFNPCCIQRYKSHVHRSYGSGDMIAQSYPCAPKPQNMMGTNW